MGFFNKLFNKKEEEKNQLKEDLNKGLEKSRKGFFGKLATTFAGKSTIDVDVLDDLEDILIASDVGVDTTIKIIERIETRVANDKYLTTKELNEILRDEIVQLLAENNTDNLLSYNLNPDTKPYVILVVGVNGVGKTTSIGKLANKYKEAGMKVVLGAADTFRAAAVDQLEIWANRVGCDFYSKGMNTDPAAVAYETVRYAKDNGHDLVLIDTAGRLHNKKGLMKELEKIHKAIGKQVSDAPHEVMLVLDGSTGQNAYEQAKHFSEVTKLNCLALTKLDGTAKGGVVIGISDQLKVPIKYIGVGEGIHHLQEFDKREFVDSFFKDSNL
jgi:fused signal recognition particle receptor